MASGADPEMTRMARYSSTRIIAAPEGSVGEIRFAGADLLQRSLERSVGSDSPEVGRVLRAELSSFAPGPRGRPGKALNPGPQFVVHTVVVPLGVKCHERSVPIASIRPPDNFSLRAHRSRIRPSRRSTLPPGWPLGLAGSRRRA